MLACCGYIKLTSDSFALSYKNPPIRVEIVSRRSWTSWTLMHIVIFSVCCSLTPTFGLSNFLSHVHLPPNCRCVSEPAINETWFDAMVKNINISIMEPHSYPWCWAALGQVNPQRFYLFIPCRQVNQIKHINLPGRDNIFLSRVGKFQTARKFNLSKLLMFKLLRTLSPKYFQ